MELGELAMLLGIERSSAHRLNNKEYEKAGKFIREIAIDLSKKLGYTVDTVVSD